MLMEASDVCREIRSAGDGGPAASPINESA